MIKALILAAGKGTRLFPYTEDRPKCMVSLCGRSLLARQVEVLNSQDVSSITVVGGYNYERIQRAGYDCVVNYDYATTNMVSTIFCARDRFADLQEDLVISYGDICFQEDNLSQLLACDEEVALMVDKSWRTLWDLRFEDPLSDAETLTMDADGYIKELGKKPESYKKIQAQYTGLIKVRSDKIKDLMHFYDGMDRSAVYDGQDFSNMYMTSFLQALIDAGWRVKGVVVNNGWLEVDTVEDLKIYERLAETGRLDDICKLG